MSYTDDYFANFGSLSVDDYVNVYLRGSEQEMGRIAQTVELLPGDIASVLDVGAGVGLLLEQIERRRGIRGVGVEITDAKVDYARSRGVDMRKGDASKLDFPDRSFDLVAACEVLEHLPYGVYEATLSELMRVSRRYVIISVPFDETRLFTRCPYCRASVARNYHMREFDEQTVSALFQDATLVRTALVGRQQVAPLLDWWRRLRHTPWPPFLICPSCGYRETLVPAATNEDRLARSGLSSRSQAVSRRLAAAVLARMAKNRPRWLLALYSNDAQ